MWDIVKVRSSCQARIGLNTQYVGKQVNNIFDNLPNTDLDYDSAVKSFSDYFDQIRNKDMTIFDLRELKQEENKSLWKQIFQMAEDQRPWLQFSPRILKLQASDAKIHTFSDDAPLKLLAKITANGSSTQDQSTTTPFYIAKSKSVSPVLRLINCSWLPTDQQ